MARVVTKRWKKKTACRKISLTALTGKVMRSVMSVRPFVSSLSLELADFDLAGD